MSVSLLKSDPRNWVWEWEWELGEGINTGVSSSQLFLKANRSSPHQDYLGDDVTIWQCYYDIRERMLDAYPPTLCFHCWKVISRVINSRLPACLLIDPGCAYAQKRPLTEAQACPVSTPWQVDRNAKGIGSVHHVLTCKWVGPAYKNRISTENHE